MSLPHAGPFGAVEQYVPHRGAMSLLDTIVYCDDQRLQAEVHIGPATTFLGSTEQVPNWVGIEYMAQAIAAWSGVQAVRRGAAVKLGYLLGTRHYTAMTPGFALGQTLVIDVQCLYFEQSLGKFDCTISADGLVAKAALTVYQP